MRDLARQNLRFKRVNQKYADDVIANQFVVCLRIAVSKLNHRYYAFLTEINVSKVMNARSVEYTLTQTSKITAS